MMKDLCVWCKANVEARDKKQEARLDVTVRK